MTPATVLQHILALVGLWVIGGLLLLQREGVVRALVRPAATAPHDPLAEVDVLAGGEP